MQKQVVIIYKRQRREKGVKYYSKTSMLADLIFLVVPSSTVTGVLKYRDVAPGKEIEGFKSSLFLMSNCEEL